MKHAEPAFLVVLYVTIVQAASQHPASTSQLSDEDRQVIGITLEQFKGDTSALLLDSTVSMCGGEIPALCIRQALLDEIEPAAWIPTDRTALRNAFAARNRTPIGLGGLSVEARIVDGAQIRTMFAKGPGWPEVGKKFPGVRHVVQVSAPAYTADGNRALVYVEARCPGRCGGGSILLLRHLDGRWRVERSLLDWVG